MTRAEAAQILGISPQANENTIKKAFRKKAMKLHPDRNKAANARSQFIEVHEAYEYLSDLATGRTTETSSSRHKTRPSSQSSKFRSPHHKHRHYTDPYASMSREEFEERYNRAQRAADEAFTRKSEIIYQISLDEYQNTWRRKVAILMAGVGLILAVLFITDYFLGTKSQTLSRSAIQVSCNYHGHLNSGNNFVEINNTSYRLKGDAFYFLDNPNTKYIIETTKLFNDIISISIICEGNKMYLSHPISAHGSFPLIPFLLFIPFLSLWLERPKFNFVFLVVNYNIYVFPIFVIILMFNDGRLWRLFGL